MPLLFRFRVSRRGGSSVVEEGHSPQPFHRPPAPSQIEVEDSLTSDFGISLSLRYAQMAQDLRPSMPPSFLWLEPENLKIFGEHPMGAGGFTNIWEGIYDGRKVVLKSYRCYMTFDLAQVIAVR